ncbi:DsbA family protein [Photobacterium sp. TY1-4]|uniref:DsbA family oxidoreductase n=1 Tax=Photobacterium sp. TY1-4 TaxID=2899122 RepID=UPI0021BE7DCD|nr:DsbA family oxidoreductase [Photobacterium sp. TY1-4]UXI04461.1 DsbA family oxidoreductase [Photobacterium sp. TY1-4]
MTQSLTIDVYFDFICPWCLIGKKYLDKALEQLTRENPQLDVDIRWHGVQLLTELPLAGVPFREFYLQRLGGVSAVELRQRQVRQAAAAAGTSIDFSTIKKIPNTKLAHRLFRQVGNLGDAARQTVLLERMFAAYFHLGEDLSDPSTLLMISEECGYTHSEIDVDAHLDGHMVIQAADRPLATSVPYFVIKGQHAISGAQSADVLADACRYVLYSSSPSCVNLPIS